MRNTLGKEWYIIQLDFCQIFRIVHKLDEGFSLNCTTMYFTGPAWLLGGIYNAVKVSNRSLFRR